MADARVPYLLSYLLAIVVVAAATILCFAGRITADSWFQCLLCALASLGLIHMPSPSELLKKIGGPTVSVLFLLLFGGCEASVRMPPRDAQTAQVSPQGGTIVDYLTMSPRLAPGATGLGVVYTDSQTGRVRFLDTTGGSIEAGTAARVQTLSANPMSPEEGRFYENTTSHLLLYWNGSSWQTLATTSATGVSAGSYPSTGRIPTFTVGADGRLTAAGSTADGSALTGVQAAGISLTGQTLWATPALGEIGYVSGNNTLAKAKADSSSTVAAVCVYQGTAGACQTDGPASVLPMSGLTVAAGDYIYLSAATAGRATNIEPIGIGQFSLFLGVLVDASGYNSMAGSAQKVAWRPESIMGPLSGMKARRTDKRIHQ